MVTEIVLAFVSESCPVCEKTKESLSRDFLKHDILLSFVEIGADDPQALNLGVLFFPAFYVCGTIFYSVYDQRQIKNTVRSIKEKHNVE